MTSSSPAIRSAICCACTGERRVEVGRRGDHLVADAVALGRLDDRVRRRLAAGRAGHQRGQLAAEVDELLGQHLTPAAAAASKAGSAHSSGRADEPDALAVVPAAGGLQHAREAERRDVVDRRSTTALRGHGTPSSASRRRITRLVLGVHQRLGPGAHGDAGGLERVQVLGRHVLVVEGDHRAARR